MKAQISLEFLVVVAVYLSILSLLISSQQNIASDLKNSTSKIMNSKNSSFIDFTLSLKNIYASTKFGKIYQPTNTSCNIIGEIYCGKDESRIKEKLYIGEEDGQLPIK